MGGLNDNRVEEKEFARSGSTKVSRAKQVEDRDSFKAVMGFQARDKGGLVVVAMTVSETLPFAKMFGGQTSQFL